MEESFSMELNGIPLSRCTANLLFLPIDHLMAHTFLAAKPEAVPAFYREEYAEQIWDPNGDYMAECRRLNGTTCQFCGDSGWVSDGRRHFLTNDALPCRHCDMLARRRRTERMRLTIMDMPIAIRPVDMVNLIAA